MMELYADVEGLIKYMSRKFGAVGHYALDPEELESEGGLVFAKVLSKHSDLPPENFIQVFKTSLYNHYKGMLEKYRYTSKRGYSVSDEGDNLHTTDTYIDLSDIAESVGYQAFVEVYYLEYVEAVRQIIQHLPDTLTLFNCLVNIPNEVEILALEENKRKTFLARTQGTLLRNVGVVRVHHKHVAQYLGWNIRKVSEHLQVLKKAVLEVIYGTDQNIIASAV